MSLTSAAPADAVLADGSYSLPQLFRTADGARAPAPAPEAAECGKGLPYLRLPAAGRCDVMAAEQALAAAARLRLSQRLQVQRDTTHSDQERGDAARRHAKEPIINCARPHREQSGGPTFSSVVQELQQPRPLEEGAVQRTRTARPGTAPAVDTSGCKGHALSENPRGMAHTAPTPIDTAARRTQHKALHASRFSVDALTGGDGCDGFAAEAPAAEAAAVPTDWSALSGTDNEQSRGSSTDGGAVDVKPADGHQPPQCARGDEREHEYTSGHSAVLNSGTRDGAATSSASARLSRCSSGATAHGNAVDRYGSLLMSSAGWRCTEIFDKYDKMLLSQLEFRRTRPHSSLARFRSRSLQRSQPAPVAFVRTAVAEDEEVPPPFGSLPERSNSPGLSCDATPDVPSRPGTDPIGETSTAIATARLPLQPTSRTSIDLLPCSRTDAASALATPASVTLWRIAAPPPLRRIASSGRCPQQHSSDRPLGALPESPTATQWSDSLQDSDGDSDRDGGAASLELNPDDGEKTPEQRRTMLRSRTVHAHSGGQHSMPPGMGECGRAGATWGAALEALREEVAPRLSVSGAGAAAGPAGGAAAGAGVLGALSRYAGSGLLERSGHLLATSWGRLKGRGSTPQASAADMTDRATNSAASGLLLERGSVPGEHLRESPGSQSAAAGAAVAAFTAPSPGASPPTATASDMPADGPVPSAPASDQPPPLCSAARPVVPRCHVPSRREPPRSASASQLQDRLHSPQQRSHRGPSRLGPLGSQDRHAAIGRQRTNPVLQRGPAPVKDESFALAGSKDAATSPYHESTSFGRFRPCLSSDYSDAASCARDPSPRAGTPDGPPCSGLDGRSGNCGHIGAMAAPAKTATAPFLRASTSEALLPVTCHALEHDGSASCPEAHGGPGATSWSGWPAPCAAQGGARWRGGSTAATDPGDAYGGQGVRSHLCGVLHAVLRMATRRKTADAVGHDRVGLAGYTASCINPLALAAESPDQAGTDECD